MRYNKIEFTNGLSGNAYQLVNDFGEVLGYYEDDGKKIDFVRDEKEIVYEARFVEENAKVSFQREEIADVVSQDIVVEPPTEEMPGTVDELEAKIRQVVASM